MKSYPSIFSLPPPPPIGKKTAARPAACFAPHFLGVASELRRRSATPATPTQSGASHEPPQHLDS